MTDDVLIPPLTASDRRVLACLPRAGFADVRARTDLMTVWQVAEELDTRDVDDVRLTLRALEHQFYAASARSKSRKRRVWWRTAQGDEALGTA